MRIYSPELAALVGLVPYTLLLWGLVYLVTASAIFAPVRMFVTWAGGVYAATGIYCPACTGFWFGLALGALGAWPFMVLLWAPLDAAIASVALGALWTRIGPENHAWSVEIGDRFDHPRQEEELEHG